MRTGRTLGAAVWMPNVSGGHTLTILAANTNGAVQGIRADGGMLVGFISSPVYRLAQPGGTWSAPITVAGGCYGVRAVSDASRLVLNKCPLGAGNKVSGAYADPPYTSLTRLGRLGPTFEGNVTSISHGGRYASGFIGSTGVYWALP